MSRERIERELAVLHEGGLEAALVSSSRGDCVLYRNLPTRGAKRNLPSVADVIVPVPSGYPAAAIDLAGLTANSALLPHLVGGTNSQGTFVAEGQTWQLASYHPHGNGGGPPWDPMQCGFHTYVDHLLAWLARLNQ